MKCEACGKETENPILVRSGGYYKGVHYTMLVGSECAKNYKRATNTDRVKTQMTVIAPPKAMADDSVKKMQIYLGSVGRVSFRDEQKLRSRLDRSLKKIASKTGQHENEWWSLVEKEAKRRGLIMATPGKDI